MLFVLTAASFLLLGHELSRRLWRERMAALHPAERWSSAILIGVASWLAVIWATALTHTMTRPVLLTGTAAAAVIALVLFLRRKPAPAMRSALRFHIDSRSAAALLIALLPVGLWTEFVLWRGAIVPPLNHDALAYHLPKAVLFERANGFEYLDDLDSMTRKLPANYELMLADVLIIEGNDAITEWLSTLFYLFVIVGSVALVQRWWGRDLLSELVVCLLVAGAPVLLLASGAHKNDLVTGGCMIAALVWGGKWISEREIPALLLFIVAVAIAIGTKPQAAALAGMLAPFILWVAWRDRARFTGRQVAGVVAFGIAALAFLGSAVYAVNFWVERSFAGHVATARNARAAFSYGDWANLWQAPYVLLAGPLSPDPFKLRVPWSETAWFWRRYELFFSHLGIGFTLCCLLLPFALLRSRSAGTERSRQERLFVGLAALAAFVLMLPVVFWPHGMYAISLPRYSLFILPVVLALSVPPLMKTIEARRPRTAMAVLCATSALFVWYAVDFAVHDAFVPLRYVLLARQHPGIRVVPFFFTAGQWADHFAGPREPVAVYSAYGTWIYPLFGEDLGRPVQLLPPDRPVKIDDAVRWVVFDRMFAIVWQNPKLHDLSDARRFITRGQLSPEDDRFLAAMLNDHRFRLVYSRPLQAQAVFERVAPIQPLVVR